MVASSAVQWHGFEPDQYILINAAVPIEAYAPTQTKVVGETRSMEELMTEKRWQEYLGIADKAFAWNWHKLHTDSRNRYTWSGLFDKVPEIGFHFFSTGEEVLKNSNSIPSLARSFRNIVIEYGLNGTYWQGTWLTQEIIKGSNSLVVEPVSWGLYGGWGFNPLRLELVEDEHGNFFRKPTDPAVVLNLPNENLQIKPLFMPFGGSDSRFPSGSHPENLMSADGNSEGNAEGLKDITLYTILGEAIPARSFAAGANRVDTFGASVSIDMNGFSQDSEWPAYRFSDTSRRDDWLHSDFRDVALPYVSDMWLEMITIGDLDQ